MKTIPIFPQPKRTTHLVESLLDSFFHIFVLFTALVVVYLTVFSKERKKSSNNAIRGALSSLFRNLSFSKHCSRKEEIEKLHNALNTVKRVDTVHYLTNDWIRHTAIIGLSFGGLILIITLAAFRRTIPIKRIVLFNLFLLGLVGAFEFWFIQTYAMHIQPISSKEFENHVSSQVKSNDVKTSKALKSVLYPSISPTTWVILAAVIIGLVVLHAKEKENDGIQDTFSKLMYSFAAIAITVTLIFVFIALPSENRYVKSQINETITRLRAQLPPTIQRAIQKHIPKDDLTSKDSSSSPSYHIPKMMWVHVGIIALVAFVLGLSNERNPRRILFVIGASACASFFVEFSFLKFLASRESMFNVVDLEHQFVDQYNQKLQASCSDAK